MTTSQVTDVLEYAVAGTFVVGGSVSVVLFAEAELTHTTIIAIATAIVIGISGAFTFVGKYLLDSQARELGNIRDEKAQVWENLERWRDNSSQWHDQCRELAAIVEEYINRKRQLDGRGEFTRVAAVVPEHNSPVSSQQQVDADMKTMKSKIIAVRKELGLPDLDQ